MARRCDTSRRIGHNHRVRSKRDHNIHEGLSGTRPRDFEWKASKLPECPSAVDFGADQLRKSLDHKAFRGSRTLADPLSYPHRDRNAARSRAHVEHSPGRGARSVGVNAASTWKTRLLVSWLRAVVAFKHNDMADSLALVQHLCVLIFG